MSNKPAVQHPPTSEPSSPRRSLGSAWRQEESMRSRINWDTYGTAYQQLVQRGVDHDAASDKALYLASRALPTTSANWSLLAYQIRVSLWRRSENRLCVSLNANCLPDTDAASVALEEMLAAPSTTDPERVALAREELERVPGDILNLFLNRHRPLTSTEATHIHRFRRRLAAVYSTPTEGPS